MIIIKVIGGLGNQMFQFALYKKIESMGKNVKLDLSPFNTYDLHNGFELDRIFPIEYKTISEKESKYYQNNSFLYKLYRKIINKNYYKEPAFNFNKNIFELNAGYLDGYWQSEKYFNDIRPLINSSFKFKLNLDELNKITAKSITSCNSVSIHIRRGDYVTNPKAAELHGGICHERYYRDAINIIKGKVKDPTFFVFSDDSDWVKSNIKIDSKNIIFIDWNKGEKSYIDMQLMSLCQHNIIANSTFSWWAAWLNKNNNKIIIAPKKWFNDNNINVSDLIPPTWIRI
jgi:hypothetical protein